MKRYLTISLFLLLLVGVIGAQESDWNASDRVTVVLKRGIVLQGHFIDVDPGVAYVLRTIHGDSVRIPDRLLKKVQYGELHQYQSSLPKLERAYRFSEEGFYMASSLGLLIGASNESGGLTGIELSASAGWQYSRLLGIGFGTGLDFYHPRGEEVILPVFAEVRGYFLERKITPYYALRAGYGIALRNERSGIVGAEGGWMLNPVIGWRLGGRTSGNMTIDFGVKFQKANFDFERRNEQSQVSLFYKRLNVRLGILF